MNVGSIISRKQEHEHDHAHEGCADCGHDHSHTNFNLKRTVFGLVLIVNSFLVEWILDRSSVVADISAAIGALVLGFPILITAFKDLRRGVLSTNELVALAVTASFASGHYQEAGVVAFFMLIGEIIETRTAEGAINVPLGEDGAARISASRASHDGYLRDGTDDQNDYSLRAQLKAKLTPDVTVRVSADYAHVGGAGTSVSYQGNYLPLPTGAPRRPT